MNKHKITSKSGDELEPLKSLRAIRLPDERKETMRDRLVAYSEMKPATQISAAKDSTTTSSFFMWLLKPALAIPVILILMVSAGGSLSIAATGALPGDTLYPVKIHFNESIERLAARSTEAKAALALELTSRRISESIALGGSHALDKETYEKLDAAIAKNAQEAEAIVLKLELEGNNAIASEMQSSLESQLALYMNTRDPAIEETVEPPVILATGPTPSTSEPATKDVSDTESTTQETKKAAVPISMPSSSVTDVTPASEADADDDIRERIQLVRESIIAAEETLDQIRNTNPDTSNDVGSAQGSLKGAQDKTEDEIESQQYPSIGAATPDASDTEVNVSEPDILSEIPPPVSIPDDTATTTATSTEETATSTDEGTRGESAEVEGVATTTHIQRDITSAAN